MRPPTHPTAHDRLAGQHRTAEVGHTNVGPNLGCRDGLVTAGADAGTHTINNIQMPRLPVEHLWSHSCSISSFRFPSTFSSYVFDQFNNRSAIELEIRSLNQRGR